MPARKERIYIYIDSPSHPNQTISFPLWWDRREFFEKFGERQIDLGNPIYVDYAFLLTSYEARFWDEKSKKQYHAEKGMGNRHIEVEMNRIEFLLKSAKWIIVESYEWESGAA